MAAVDDDLGVINEHEYDDDDYTEASQEMADQGSELIDHLWVAGASVTNLADELTNALHNSVVSGALNLVVKIERKS